MTLDAYRRHLRFRILSTSHVELLQAGCFKGFVDRISAIPWMVLLHLPGERIVNTTSQTTSCTRARINYTLLRIYVCSMNSDLPQHAKFPSQAPQRPHEWKAMCVLANRRFSTMGFTLGNRYNTRILLGHEA